MPKLRVVFMGTPDFSVPTLSEIVCAGHDVVAVYTQPPRRAGRGMELRPSPVHAFADEAGIPVYTPRSRSVADEMQEDVDKYAFYGGEDYEMLFTLHEEDVEKLKTEFDDFSVIGKIADKHNQLTINTGEDKTIKVDLFET